MKKVDVRNAHRTQLYIYTLVANIGWENVIAALTVSDTGQCWHQQKTIDNVLVSIAIHQFCQCLTLWLHIFLCTHACMQSTLSCLSFKPIISMAANDDDDDAKRTLHCTNAWTCRQNEWNKNDPKPSIIIRTKWITLEPITITICNRSVVGFFPIRSFVAIRAILKNKLRVLICVHSRCRSSFQLII